MAVGCTGARSSDKVRLETYLWTQELLELAVWRYGKLETRRVQLEGGRASGSSGMR